MRKVSSFLQDTKFVVGFLSIAAVTLLALFAFILSYSALQELARDSGAVSGSLSYLWPLLVDIAIAVFASVALFKAMSGMKANTQRFLVLLFAGLSMVFNVTHAPANLVAQLIAAVPPFVLLLGVESLLELVGHAVGTGKNVEADKLSAELRSQDSQMRQLASQNVELTNALDVIKARTERAKAVQRGLRVVAWKRDGMKCVDCDIDLQEDSEFHCHHAIPRSEGGKNELDNLVTLCKECHGKRHSIMPQAKHEKVPSTCPECPRTFGSKQAVSAHIRHAHRGHNSLEVSK